MTIAAGFACRDGLLFASDTLYSGEQKRYGHKFWQSQWGDAVVVFGGAGTAAGLWRTRDEIERRARPMTDRHDIVQAVEEALLVVDDKLKHPDHKTQALVGVRIGGRCWLYENQIGPMLNQVGSSSQCVGIGSSLGTYFADSLFRSNMTMEWAKVVAAHLVKQVKVYSSGYCGGRTHLIELPSAGQPKFIVKKADVVGYENYLADIDQAMQLVLPDKRTNEDTVRHRLARITETIKALRTQFSLEPEAGTLSIAGELTTVTIRKPPPAVPSKKDE